jgi:tetratricopeptide (TPR) repeat protein
MSGKPRKIVLSHAAGGPSTSRGLGYQVNFAIYQALELVIHSYSAPHKSTGLGIESRTVHGPDGVVTAGDIVVDDGGRIVWEAKLSATRHEVVEWLGSVRAASDAGDDMSEFGLVYSQVKTPILSGIARLRDVAVECGGSDSKFSALARDTDHLTAIRSILGPDYLKLLARLRFVNAPEPLLADQLRDRARFLAGEDADRLIAFLYQLFSAGASNRHHYETTQIIQSVKEQSIGLSPPPGRAFIEVPVLAQRALIVLAACPSGLPCEALCAATEVNVADLTLELQSFVQQKMVVEDCGTLRLVGWRPSFEQHLDFLEASLDRLLSWLLDHEMSPLAGIATRGAMSIARLALKRRPGLALKLFQAAEHVIKNLGDKHMLLEVSELCIQAANDPCDVDRDLKAKAKAQAMLCGHSWVYQRTGRLSEARVWAEKSERLGRDIGWGRNTAFARKCLGRLDRIQAETADDPMKKVLLASSEEKLREAITLFSQSTEFGASSRQVGDCYSLLGRTQITAGDRLTAAESIRKADEILTPAAMKEYFDLKILAADLEAAKGNFPAAEQYYSEVVDTHISGQRELSEICARAYARRGQVRMRSGRKDTGARDLSRAAETWRALDEHEFASEAEWTRLSADSRIDQRILSAFSGVSPVLVRVLAFNDYQKRIATVKVIARRAIPTKGQVEQLAQEARKRTAEEHPEW